MMFSKRSSPPKQCQSRLAWASAPQTLCSRHVPPACTPRVRQCLAAHGGGAAILSDRVFRDRGRSGVIGNVAAGGIVWLLLVSAYAQTDEIQVYDATIHAPGQFTSNCTTTIPLSAEPDPTSRAASCRTKRGNREISGSAIGAVVAGWSAAGRPPPAMSHANFGIAPLARSDLHPPVLDSVHLPVCHPGVSLVIDTSAPHA